MAFLGGVGLGRVGGAIGSPDGLQALQYVSKKDKSLQRLTKDYPQVNLAFSLHSPFEEERNLLVPINKTHPFPQVLEEFLASQETTKKCQTNPPNEIRSTINANFEALK